MRGRIPLSWPVLSTAVEAPAIGLPRDQCYWYLFSYLEMLFVSYSCCLTDSNELMDQGVKAVIAKSFERIHRSNLVGMGIIPLCFKPGEDAETLGLTGHEQYTIDLPSSVSEIKPGQDVTVVADNGKSFTCTARFDTEVKEKLSPAIWVFLVACI